jgi:hypothetical protein
MLTREAWGQTYLFGRADFSVGNFASFVTTGDFNGDGRLDLAVSNRSDGIVSVPVGQA